MINTNQPESAFPSTFKSLSPEEGQAHRWGMTLRDYFAAKAMQEIIGSDKYMGLIGVNRYEQRTAEDAYKMADVMLKARDA
jgi:hypothetical protein